MPRFQYSARSAGTTTNGVLEAPDMERVANMLVERGAIPIKIEAAIEVQANQDLQLPSFLKPTRVKLEELILLSQQLRSLARAGIPIVRALRSLCDSNGNAKLRQILNEVVDSLESGSDLATSLGRHPDVFSDLYVSVIHVGENTGRMDEAFEQIARYLTLERDTKRRISAATRYPAFVIFTIFVAIGIINGFVIPAFADVFAKYGAELPWQTRTLIAVSDFTVNYWWLMFGLAVTSFFSFWQWKQTVNGRLLWDRFKLRIPLLGGIFDCVNLGRFCQTFAIVLKAGVPLIQGLNVVSRAIGNAYVADRIDSMRTGIERGDTITRTASATGLFSPVVLQMMAVGEETGRIDELLAEASVFYSEEVDYRLRTLTEAIEPILVIAIGGLVLIMALGVFLPLWDLSSVALK